eukprot:m.40773 g.40773  ORF g.40773 m.40773 type:complete len:351 (-) comp8128_c0_seq1:111-1163(-)
MMLRQAAHCWSRAAAAARMCSSKAAPRGDFTGVWPIMATPFHADARETIDFNSFTRAVGFMKDVGVNGITIAGVLGESNRLLDSELRELILAAVDAAGAMPVCVGISHAGTAATAGRAELVAECGASSVMITPLKEPVPLPPNKIAAHYTAVAEAVPEIDIVLQDHPASTQVRLSLPVIADIVEAAASIKCIKLESTPTAARTQELIQLMDQREGIVNRPTILTGLGGLYGSFELAAGADGFMTGFAFPEVLIAMVQAARLGESGKADCERIFKEYLPLIVFEQQPGVATRKHIYTLRGLFDSGHVRHPGAQISPASAAMAEELVAATFPDGVTKPMNWKRAALFSLPLQ